MTSIADTTGTSQQDQRAAALKYLHRVIADPWSMLNRQQAIMTMAIRYGEARVVQRAADNQIAWDLADRARSRRFAALQRLVYGGPQ